MRAERANHLTRATALADKITSKAEDALAGLNREMAIMKWPPEFRKIMWDAVAQVAVAYSRNVDKPKGEPS